MLGLQYEEKELGANLQYLHEAQEQKLPLSGIEWNQQNYFEALGQIGRLAETTLMDLRSPTGMYIWASDSPKLTHASYGRDTCEIAEKLAHRPEHQEQCCKWLKALAAYQGVKYDTFTDERPGAIPHEIRALVMDGEEVDEGARIMFFELRPRWSRDPEAETIYYYGELDGPERFIRACLKLAKNGVDLSQEKFIHELTGEERSLLDACVLAAGFTADRMEESDLGLVELQPPENWDTLTNQTLKDSRPAYLFRLITGTPWLPNRHGPRAPLEAQLLGIEAFTDLADLQEAVDLDFATKLRQHAESLKKATRKNFIFQANDDDLMQNDKWPYPYMAAMLDRHPAKGEVRQVNTKMCDAAEGSLIYMDDDPESQELLESMTRMILSEDFLTDGGIRCRALSDHGLFDFAEYHGSLTDWVVVTHTIAKKQLELGHPRIAAEIWTRMLCAMVVSGSFHEFGYFDEANRLLLEIIETQGQPDFILRGEEPPQTNQAFSASAALEACDILAAYDLENYPSRDRAFEDEMLDSIPQYRHRPDELIAKIKRDSVTYKLEKVPQLAGAHEPDLDDFEYGRQVLRPAA